MPHLSAPNSPHPKGLPLAAASSSLTPGGGRLLVAQGVVGAVSFSLLLAGSNAITPLMPIYRTMLGFTPLSMSLTFVSYVGVMTVTLLVLSRPSMMKRSGFLLLGALLLAAAADAMLGVAAEPFVLTGRAMSGVAGGLGTGAAAALVVTSLGHAGRSVSATGNLVGAIVGTVFAQACVAIYAEEAVHWTYILHAIACIAAAGALTIVLIACRTANRELLSIVNPALPRSTTGLRSTLMPLAVGCMAWCTLSTSLVYLPTYFAETRLPQAQTFGTIAMLTLSAAAQLGSPWAARRLPWASGLPTMALGIAGILAGARLGWDVLAIAGSALTGAGLGASHRLGLVMFTKGTPPADHGALSSFYAATTYLIAGLSVLGSGMLGSVLGLEGSVLTTFAVLGTAAAGLAWKAPRLRDSHG
ncbi:MFS transporter [Arthrobacter sp. AFG20]|uniref:MFS transporter n=1 Tax=Arthrobacter sp. AFG20 TaxID=1688671 RepID=UPI0035B5C7CF